MGKVVKYFCDNCNKEVKEEDLKLEKIPFMKEMWAKNGLNVKLIFGGYHLEFEEQSLCEDCSKIYKQCWMNAMNILANHWDKIKNNSK